MCVTSGFVINKELKEFENLQVNDNDSMDLSRGEPDQIASRIIQASISGIDFTIILQADFFAHVKITVEITNPYSKCQGRLKGSGALAKIITGVHMSMKDLCPKIKS